MACRRDALTDPLHLHLLSRVCSPGRCNVRSLVPRCTARLRDRHYQGLCPAVDRTDAPPRHRRTSFPLTQGEDFSGDLGGIALPNGIDAQDAAAQLNAAAARIPAEQAPAIRLRLRWRHHWLLALSAMTSEEPDASLIDLHLSVCRSIWSKLQPDAPAADTLALQDAALARVPPHLQAFFDITLSRHFSTTIPMRPQPLREARAVWEWWHRVLHEEVALPLPLLRTDRVACWWMHMRLHALAFQQSTPIPFVRSLLSTYVSDGYTCAGGTRDLRHLASSWLEEWTTLSIDDIYTRLEWLDARYACLTDRSEPAAGQAQRLDRFLQRLAGLEADHLGTYAANRARQKRGFGKSYVAWADLLDEAVSLSAHLATALPSLCPPDLLVRPVQCLVLASMEQALGAGIELNCTLRMNCRVCTGCLPRSRVSLRPCSMQRHAAHLGSPAFGMLLLLSATCAWLSV